MGIILLILERQESGKQKVLNITCQLKTDTKKSYELSAYRFDQRSLPGKLRDVLRPYLAANSSPYAELVCEQRELSKSASCGVQVAPSEVSPFIASGPGTCRKWQKQRQFIKKEIILRTREQERLEVLGDRVVLFYGSFAQYLLSPAFGYLLY